MDTFFPFPELGFKFKCAVWDGNLSHARAFLQGKNYIILLHSMVISNYYTQDTE